MTKLYKKGVEKLLKVLWVVNGPTSKIANDLGISTKDSTGWLTGFANELENKRDIELTIAFPLLNQTEQLSGRVGRINYVSFYQPGINRKINIPKNKITELTIEQITNIIDEVKPDLLHLFGTEFEHSLVAAKIFNKPDKTLIHIQGLVSVIARHYYSGLPIKVYKKFAISNFIRGNLLKQKKKFESRGGTEIELLKFVNNVVGRTDWDEACTKQINPSINYFFCNESLRDEFYKNKWDISKIQKYSIFMSQATYPIKGIHFMIEALPGIIKRFPNTHLYVAGNDLTSTNGIYNKVRISSYGLYIKELIRKNNLEKHITFTGFLDEKQMCKRYLQSNVFVSSSVIENSPNSVGEAMILGVPTISSDVGGVKNIFTHGLDGYTYQYDAPYMLTHYICKLFESEQLCNDFSQNARRHALELHDRGKNISEILNIYNKIAVYKH